MTQRKQPQSELAVITQAKCLCAYVMDATQKSPKAFRFTFVTRMQNLSLDIVEQLFRANEVFITKGDATAPDRRFAYQHEASVSLKMLLYVAEIAKNRCCITSKQYEEICKRGFDVGNLLGGWINSDKKRFSPNKMGV